MEIKEAFRGNGFKVSVLKNCENILFKIEEGNKMYEVDNNGLINFIKNKILENREFIAKSNNKLGIKKAKILMDSNTSQIFVLFYNKLNLPVKIIKLDNNFENYLKSLENGFKLHDFLEAIKYQILDIIDTYNINPENYLYREIGRVDISNG